MIEISMDLHFIHEKIRECYSENVTIRILNGLKERRNTTFRVNNLKGNMSDVENELNSKNILYSIIKSKINIIRLENHFVNNDNIINLTNLDIYKEGKIYLQSISSMIPVLVLNPVQNENILDMCAAPGGKTTLIQSLSNNKVNLTATELHKDRFERLKYNIDLQGCNVYSININALQLNDNLKFDKILLDAPCSGLGIIDLNRPEKNFTNNLIDKCINAQKKLIDKAHKLLKKDGTLIYSTCSLLKCENEDIIDFAVKKGFSIEPLKIEDYLDFVDNKILNIESVVSDGRFIKILPDSLFEGFFIAKLYKH